MAPARSSSRRPRATTEQNTFHHPPGTDNDIPETSLNDALFIDPMLGTPLSVYIAKDVDDLDSLIQLVTKHGGTVSPSYSGVTYILVDPYKSTGQNLWRHYANKKGKVVLSYRWIHECIKSGQLQIFHTNWAGCRVTGNETAVAPNSPPSQPNASTINTSKRRTNRQVESTSTVTVAPEVPASVRQPPPPPPQQHPYVPAQLPPMSQVDTLVHAQTQFPFYPPQLQSVARGLHVATAAPPQSWQAPSAIAPQQTHLTPPQPPPTTHPHMIHRATFREETWDSYESNHGPDALGAPPPTGYDYRFRDDQHPWAAPPHPYYDPSNQYEPTFEQPAPYADEPPTGTPVGAPPPLPPVGPSQATAVAPLSPQTVPDDSGEKRGRRRTRAQPTPATPAASLVVNRNPPARSPTPPTRVIKSTYGGNLFTTDDIAYLKKYIDYCHEQGLVLSLREICERIAIKAPHHTFYSWRRYCNKHQIRLTGYIMHPERPESPLPDSGEIQEEEGTPGVAGNELIGQQQQIQATQQQRHQPSQEPVVQPAAGPGPATMATVQQRLATAATLPPRTRSPTPPRALYRSTTGKGVAFTADDIVFLVKFMDYRKQQGRLDMVAFWKDVAAKAPHHSRASWMKFWRRHRHELQHSEGDDPLPQPPDKKMRYSADDDVLLAKYFHTKPMGTSDKVFQAFGRLHPHHPWKGWQEHYRIHKAKIEHLMQRLTIGEDINVPEPGAPE